MVMKGVRSCLLDERYVCMYYNQYENLGCDRKGNRYLLLGLRGFGIEISKLNTGKNKIKFGV